MRFGVTFPRDGLDNDPLAARDFAQAAEDLGYEHILSGDHVLGIGREQGGRDSGRPMYEPLTLFAHLAAVTRRIGFITGVLVLPQRQAALVAKQAASVDVLSGGRLRLGVGIGWHEREYDALNVDFHTRGRRIEEQIEVLRALWTRETVHFQGRWHRIDGVGLNPLPVQRPIPIWLGGYVDAALRRVARLADGWFPQSPPELPPPPPPPVAAERLQQLRRFAAELDRDPATLGVMGQLPVAAADSPGAWLEAIAAWRELGAGDFTIRTDAMPLSRHLEVLRRFKQEAG